MSSDELRGLLDHYIRDGLKEYVQIESNHNGRLECFQLRENSSIEFVKGYVCASNILNITTGKMLSSKLIRIKNVIAVAI